MFDSCLMDHKCDFIITLSESVIDSDTSETPDGGITHNVALSETLLLKQLCNCLDVNQG